MSDGLQWDGLRELDGETTNHKERRDEFVMGEADLLGFGVVSASDLARKHSELLFEALGKVRMITKSDSIGDLGHIPCVLQEKIAGSHKAHVLDELGRTQVGECEELTVQLDAAQENCLSEIFYAIRFISDVQLYR